METIVKRREETGGGTYLDFEGKRMKSIHGMERREQGRGFIA